MQIESIPGTRKAICNLAGPFQRTFATPLNRLPTFAEILLGDASPVRSGCVFVQAVVFEPERLKDLLAAHALDGRNCAGSTITANGPLECRELLTAALGDSIDFFFVPDPKQFLLYADHDEYVTLFTHKRGPLSRVSEALIGAGVKEVPDFERAL